jgi:hypothetical protein
VSASVGQDSHLPSPDHNFKIRETRLDAPSSLRGDLRIEVDDNDDTCDGELMMMDDSIVWTQLKQESTSLGRKRLCLK